MTVRELFTAAGITPNPAATGAVNADELLLAVNTGESGADPAGFAVAGSHITGVGAAIQAETQEDTFLYEGRVTTRVSARRGFTIEGKRYLGDAFQDWALSHGMKYGLGQAPRAEYIYICTRTGKGEKGILTLNVTEDSGGGAGSASEVSIEAWSEGIPEDYTLTL